MLLKHIDFKNCEVEKVISEQSRTFAWAVAGIFTYFGVVQNKLVLCLSVTFVWLGFMWFSLVVLTNVQRKINNKKE